jgi:hypothetical protein
MEGRVAQLKTDFNNISSIRSTVKNIFDTLKQRIDKLKSLYSDFIHHNDNQLFVFGLDSFRFQSKLIDLEYEDMMRLFLAINNRMYCEYFKLYKIIIAYIHENISDKKITEVIKVNNFPVYKDLEPFKEYKFETVLELHENILILLGSIMNNIENKENELAVYQKKRRIGLNIDNFVTSFNYDIIMMREKVGVFLTYIEFFHILHTKYLKRFSNKIQLMYTHINNDIKFDESVEMNREKKKEILGEFTEGDIDDELLDSLKRSVAVDSSSESSFSEGAPTPNNFNENGDNKSDRSNTFLEFCVDNKIDMNDAVYTEFGKIDTNCEELLNTTIQQHLLNIEKIPEPVVFQDKLFESIIIQDKEPEPEAKQASKLKGVVKKVILDTKVKNIAMSIIAEQPSAPVNVVETPPPKILEVLIPVVEEPAPSLPVILEEPPPPQIVEVLNPVPLVVEEPPLVVEEPPPPPPVVVEEPVEEPAALPVVVEEPVALPVVVVEEPQPVVEELAPLPTIVEEPTALPVVVEEPTAPPVVEEPAPVIVDEQQLPPVEEPPNQQIEETKTE